jgi:ribosomal protein L3
MKWVVALTCVAAALALPVAEDAIVRETTPITIMTQDPASIASAQAAASANASAAVAAEAAEKKWTEQEAQFVNSTKALNKAARDAQRKAVADNAQAAKDLADEEAAVTAKVAEANKGTF